MHLTSIGKSIVLIVAFATQCVYAKSRNGYGYFDEKFCVLEWIIYLKRLSLIALMLCSIILYYVPKSRSYARRACCILIDTIANGLKYALNTNGTEQEKIKAKNENHKNSDLKIQELYRKVYEKDARDRGQKYTDTTNFNNSNPKSIRQHKSKKFSTKHTVSKEHERYYHRNNNVLPESNAVMTSTMKFKTSQKQKDMSDINTINIGTQKLHNKQNLDCKHEKVVVTSQNSQSSKDCTTKIMNKQTDPHYEKLLTKRDTRNKLYDKLRKENCQFLLDIKSFPHNCCKNSSVTKDGTKPVLLRVANWFFGGCPSEASRRHREQIDEVGKEEIFKSTNTWLL
ncbi:uncharacterized protein LOC118644331 isoform X2 [Monomorium pharaonis]|uniref:uncharacterized protein LOC118644331 isoform X2 n=1 Tax=Monomorium pharaonis TaxID=307658 RepID=UPI001746E209|nr:uncharacterized protein LOC118644331 isoform X2 [Monomorium pharaonis]